MNRATSVLDSDRWKEMGAPSWQRVLWINDDVWYRSSGLAAAWLVLNDIKSSLNSRAWAWPCGRTAHRSPPRSPCRSAI